MYSLVFAIYDQLGEHGGHGAMKGIADVFLIVVFARSVYGDTIIIRAIGRRGPDAPYIGSVSGLRHCKTTEEFCGTYIV